MCLHGPYTFHCMFYTPALGASICKTRVPKFFYSKSDLSRIGVHVYNGLVGFNG